MRLAMNRHSIVSLAAFTMLAAGLLRGVVSTQEARNPGAAALKNPVAATPASIAAGKKAYDDNCAGCHGNRAQGAVRAGIVISIIQEQGGKQAPDLTDDKWDHGSTDGEIFTVTKKGVPPTMMAGWEGRLSDTEIWSIVNYLRALAANPNAAIESAPAAPAAPATPRKTLELADFVQMPITGDPRGELTRGLLARVNFLREEPGGRRFFVNDLNGPLYILDKKTKQFTTYLDFNGLAGRPGLFQKLTFERNFATGLINFIFDPDYARNGVFYTIHMEDPTTEAPAEPKPGVVPGLDLSGYRTTPASVTPIAPGARITREGVMIEWTDRNIANATFEGTARELLRMQLASPIHPLGEMTFNPAARRGDPDWRVMYIGAGDSGSGEQKDIRRMNPQRLDNWNGKILRIVPDLREHTATSTVSDNGRYRIPNDNPFVAVEGARKEIWAAGLRNPHRLIWDVDPARPRAPRLLAFNIGLTAWETVVIVKKGANYGYSLREGPQAMTLQGMAAGAGGRHHPGADHRHGHARHGEADLPGDCLPAYQQRRRCDCRRLHLSWHASPRAERQAAVRRHHDRPHLVRRDGGCAPGRRWRPDDARADSRAGRRSSPPRGRDLPRARRPGRSAAWGRRRIGARAGGPAFRGRQRRRALRPDEERRHDPAGGGLPVIVSLRAQKVPI